MSLVARISFFLLFVSSDVRSEDQPQVTTTTGAVRGYTEKSPMGKSVNVFLGIPFGEPPIGKKRFKHPEKIKPWSGVFNATKQPLSCFQRPFPLQSTIPLIRSLSPTTENNEDCLKLNIFVPHKLNKKEKLFPVMVWIFGGGHARGSVSVPMYNATILASEENVLVAMMNYRVGSLGFMYLDHADIPGNAGLYDQLLALQWIKENVRAFGGDPESITLFGQSSGSASVGHHLLSPLSWGLFNRAIMSSASPTSELLFLSHEDSISRTMTIVDNLGCPRNNATATVECLRSADPLDIIASELHPGFDFAYIHLPVVDGKMVPEHPRELLRQGRFANVSLLAGLLKDESTIFLAFLDPSVYVLKDNVVVTGRSIHFLMDIFRWDNMTRLMTEYIYTKELDHTDQRIISVDAVISAVSDWVFNCPLRDFEQAYARSGNRIFKYFLPHRASVLPLPKWLGTIHTQELQYIFGTPLRTDSKYTEEEKILSRRIMRYWTNFARNGYPNNLERDGEEAILWPQYTAKNKEYLVLAPNCTSIGRELFEKRCFFWQDLRPELLEMIKAEKRAEANAKQ